MTVINMLRALIENLNNIQEQMDKSKKRGKSLKQSKDNTSNQNTVTCMKNNFDGLIYRLDTDKEKISELKDMSVETSQTKM